MIHTFELSKEISKQQYEQIISQIPMKWYNNRFGTDQFKEQGISFISLRKVSDKTKPQIIHHMIYLAINPGMISGNDPYYSTNINSFSPATIEGIYCRIFDIIPCLEEYPEARNIMIQELKQVRFSDSHYMKWYLLHKAWYFKNSFTASRIDYAFDIFTNAHEYQTLIQQGWKIKSNDYLRFNIYNKKQHIEDKELPYNSENNYDFLRFELQAKSDKLYHILKKLKLNEISGYSDSQGRELEYLISPEIEENLLIYYISRITGTGTYVTKDVAYETIDRSSYSEDVKAKMKSVIDEVSKRHGIAKLLDAVKKGTVTHLGKTRTVEKYLRDIEKMGINPVTISSRMNVPALNIMNNSGRIIGSGKVLPNLVDVVKAYCRDVKEEKRSGPTLTEDDLIEIDRIPITDCEYEKGEQRQI